MMPNRGHAIGIQHTAGAERLPTALDVTFCEGRMHAAGHAGGKMPYSRMSDGGCLARICDRTASHPDTDDAAGLECSPSMTGSGTSPHHSGDDPERINETRMPAGFPASTVRTPADEPHGVATDGDGISYTAGKDDDSISITPGTPAVFATGNRIDYPRGVTAGPGHVPGISGASSQEDTVCHESNKAPGIALSYRGTATRGQMPVSSYTHLTMTADDPDGDPVPIQVAQDDLIPDVTVTLQDHRNGTATIVIDPAGAEAGAYVPRIKASDDQDHHDQRSHVLAVN